MSNPSSSRRPSAAPLAVAFLALGAAACQRSEVAQGECHPLHGAEVCLWAEQSGDALVAFGATIPMSAIENAPSDAPMVWPPVAAISASLPQAVRAATGLDNMTLYWEPHGHPPARFLAPHFDFHFNAASAGDLAAIDCADTTRPTPIPPGLQLPDLTIPQLGTLPGACVPGMGMHAVPESDLATDSLFRKTLLVGYYHGQPIFLEPMITRAQLLEHQTFSLPIPQVPGWRAGARLPRNFTAEFDAAGNAWRFVFSDLAPAPAPS